MSGQFNLSHATEHWTTVQRLVLARSPPLSARCPMIAAHLLLRALPVWAVARWAVAPASNGLPMCRRIGSIGLPAGQVWAVGTMGLLDTLNVDVDAVVAVPTVAIGAGHSLVAAAVAAAVAAVVVAVAPLVVTSPSARRSQLVGRSPLVEARCPLSDAVFPDARGPIRALRRASPAALQAI